MDHPFAYYVGKGFCYQNTIHDLFLGLGHHMPTLLEILQSKQYYIIL